MYQIYNILYIMATVWGTHCCTRSPTYFISWLQSGALTVVSDLQHTLYHGYSLEHSLLYQISNILYIMATVWSTHCCVRSPTYFISWLQSGALAVVPDVQHTSYHGYSLRHSLVYQISNTFHIMATVWSTRCCTRSPTHFISWLQSGALTGVPDLQHTLYHGYSLGHSLVYQISNILYIMATVWSTHCCVRSPTYFISWLQSGALTVVPDVQHISYHGYSLEHSLLCQISNTLHIMATVWSTHCCTRSPTHFISWLQFRALAIVPDLQHTSYHGYSLEHSLLYQIYDTLHIMATVWSTHCCTRSPTHFISWLQPLYEVSKIDTK